MRTPRSFIAKSPIPIYAITSPRSDTLIYAGGGGKSKSGVVNAIRSATIDEANLIDQTEIKLSSEEDAPMCIAFSNEDDETDTEGDIQSTSNGGSTEKVENGLENSKIRLRNRQKSKAKILVAINSTISPSGENENLRLFEWVSDFSKSKVKESRGDQQIKALINSKSVKITDSEEYIRCSAVSPDGTMIAVGSTDGQMALHAFPTLECKWILKGDNKNGIVDITFSADSALVAFVRPDSIQIYPAALDSVKPELYQSIRNPTLKGVSGCAFRAARFGRNAHSKVKSSHLYTVVNANPPPGLGSSKRDREKAKVRRCFISSWDADTWTLLQSRQISDRPATVAEISENGMYIAISTSDLSLHLLSSQSLKTIWQIRETHAFPGTCLTFSPDSKYVASGSADMTLRIAHVGEQTEGIAQSNLFEGNLATFIAALVLVILAWQLQSLILRSG